MDRIIIFISRALAADPLKASDITGLPVPRYTNVPELLGGVIEWILGFAGALAALAIIYSGIMYITAGGDAEKALKARKNFLWAVIGIVIIVLSFVIFEWINQVLFNSP